MMRRMGRKERREEQKNTGEQYAIAVRAGDARELIKNQSYFAGHFWYTDIDLLDL